MALKLRKMVVECRRFRATRGLHVASSCSETPTIGLSQELERAAVRAMVVVEWARAEAGVGEKERKKKKRKRKRESSEVS